MGSVVFEGIKAYDLDGPLFNEFSFSLTESPADKGLFQIGKTEYVSNGRFMSSLSLGRDLDYEQSRSHVVTISAIGINSPFITSTELLVNVLDYPDKAPEFSQSPYYVKIEEEMPVGAFVLQVVARDGDFGINNKCNYKIVYGKIEYRPDTVNMRYANHDLKTELIVIDHSLVRLPDQVLGIFVDLVRI